MGKKSKASEEKATIKETQVGSANFHISNSDVTFKVIDGENGPTIRIESHSFGNAAMTMNVYTDADSILRLGKMLMKASKFEFEGEEYCEPATCADIEMHDSL
jgi:hypothetical protein